MRFFSRGNHGKGIRTNDFWQWGKKIIWFSIHFDVDLEEFNQLLQNGFLNLARQRAFQSPPPHGQPPLRPHTSNSSILVETHVSLPPKIPVNDGWNDIVHSPSPCVEGWPTISLPFPPPPPPKKLAQPIVSIASHALPKNIKTQEPNPKKGKRPSHSFDSNQSQGA
jgi:hypothetical protein